MIVRVQHELADLVLGVEAPEDPGDEPGRPAVWDGERLLRMPTTGKRDVSRLKDLVPDWMSEMLADGTTLIIDNEDYLSLDHEVQQYVDIIKY